MSRQKSPDPTPRERIALHARRAMDTAQPALVQWVKGGAALGVARTGAKVALTVAKRNPAVFVAAGVLGAGVLAYRFYRKRNPTPATTDDAAAAPRAETSASARRRAIEGSGEVVARRAASRRDAEGTTAGSAETGASASAPRRRVTRRAPGASTD